MLINQPIIIRRSKYK